MGLEELTTTKFIVTERVKPELKGETLPPQRSIHSCSVQPVREGYKKDLLHPCSLMPCRTVQNLAKKFTEEIPQSTNVAGFLIAEIGSGVPVS